LREALRAARPLQSPEGQVNAVGSSYLPCYSR